jgi:hypothetical protein
MSFTIAREGEVLFLVSKRVCQPESDPSTGRDDAVLCVFRFSGKRSYYGPLKDPYG